MKSKMKRLHQMARMEAKNPSITIQEMANELDLSFSYIAKLHAEEEYSDIAYEYITKQTKKLCKETLNIAHLCVQERIIEKNDHKLAIKYIDVMNKDGGNLVNFNVDKSQTTQMYIPVYGKNDSIIHENNDELSDLDGRE